MGRRKSKKHRRERSRGSTPPREDQRKNDIETPGRSRGKTKHERIPSQGGNNPKWVKGTNSLRSAREGSPTKHTCKKPEGENRQAEPTRNKASLGCDRKGLRLPAKHLPLAHGVLTMAKSRDPEVSSKELEQRRRCLVKRRAPEEPRRKPAEAAVLPAGETRKEGVKRRSSTPEDHPAAKLRATGAQAAVTCRAKTGAAHSKESLSQVMCLTPKLPQHVCPQTRSGERERRRAGPSSGEQPASSSPPITFKIPKKPQSAAKVRRDADVFGVDGDDVSGSDGKRAPRGRVTAASPSASPSASVSGRSVPRLPEVPSTPSISSSPRQPSYVLQAQLGRPGASRERSFPSTSSASPRTERAVYRRASTETKDALDNDQEMLLVEELHLARFDRRLTVSVAESYGELTCMDVDPPEEGANTSLSEEHQDLLIVLDTNVLLSHLDFVKKMRSHGLGVLGRPTLLVPWVVLQELDALKSGKLSPEVERKARPAVRYVYGCLKNQEPRLWGQSLQQASQAACGLVAENNDDRVLHCCLQYQALYPEGSLILCTNDQNLCSKALLSGVRALCKADLEEHAQGNTALVQSSCRLHTPAPPAGPTLPEQTRRPREEEEEAGRMKASGVKCELSVCVSALERSLQGALSAVLEEEMKAAYEDLWTEIVYLKPPWTLQAVLQCIRKHWIAVFGGIIKRNLLSCVEMLITCFCSDTVVERGTVLTAACAAEELLVALGSRSSYGGHVTAALSHVRGLVGGPGTRLTNPVVEEPSDGDSLMSELVEDVAPPLQASHQEVWALFESIWNNLCQVSSAVFSVLHSPLSSSRPVQSCTTPPPQDAISCLHTLSSTLTQLLEVFRRLVSVDSTVEDAQNLLTLVRTCEMTTLDSHVTARALFECLSLQEYREKLCVGGAQLMELKGKLDQCAAAVCGQSEGSST